MATAAPRRLLRRPTVIAVLAVLVVAVGVGLYLFQPWKLFVDQTVAEAAPVAAAPAAADAPAAPVGPTVLATGELITHEHATTGTVQLLQLPDGSKVLRVQDLDTSNGPLLKVWLTDQPVIEGRDGWHVFDDGRHVDLGDLKGNIGSANYPVPADADLTGLTSVSIWCDRFDVSFGAAVLTPA
ncbi:DM13 domain-containing protein [Pseudonocardia humida]|uniref:DM13 domain-containing protein n=1 Tax=Pseudonocardia humida TaxID=2800819 RepID=A0ABT1A0N7_9PSEU|nr:DM13 domain-containing protein [Pseudonocardia humida]MCO1656560.1 DM13 domain-containing protein [Pseudonocardia humida]